MLLHLNYYQMMCDTCGKLMNGKNKTELKLKWQQQGGYYFRGGRCFCSRLCYKKYLEKTQ